MPSDVFSSYFGDEEQQPSGNDVYSSYFPEEPIGITAEGDSSPETSLGKFHNFTDQMARSATMGLSNKASALGEYAANKLMGRPADYHNALQRQQAYEENYATNHPVASKVATVLGALGGIRDVKGYTPPPSLLGKVGVGAATGASIGGLGGFGQSNDESLSGDAKNIGGNALVGAGIGAALPLAFAGGNKLVDLAHGGGAEPATIDLAQKAKDKYGIDITGAQLSNSPFVKYLDSMSAKVPLSGGADIAEQQHQQFSKAVANTFGADDLTQEGMNAARGKIRNMYNSVADNTVSIGDEQLMKGIDQVQQDAEEAGVNLNKIIDKVKSKFGDSGSISGADYKQLTAKGTPLDRLMQSSDPNVRYYAGQLGDHLDSSLARSATPEDLQTLVTANRFWKNMKTVQNLAAKSSSDGTISAGNLQGAVMKSFKDYPYTGAGDLGELAKIGQMLKPVPSSSTAERTIAAASMMFPPAAGEAMLLGQPHVALGIGATGGALMGGAKATQSILNSQWYKNRLMQAVASHGNFLENPALQGAATSLIPKFAGEEFNSLQQ